MKKKLIEHIFSIIVVGLLFSIISFFLSVNDRTQAQSGDKRINNYVQIDFIDFDDPFERALFKDVLNIFYPAQSSKSDSILSEILRSRSIQVETQLSKSQISLGLSGEKLANLVLMYLKFILIYIIVLLLTTYGVQTFASLRFIKMKQGKSSYLILFWRTIKHRSFNSGIFGWIKHKINASYWLLKAGVKGFTFLILFSPAYVIAYSFKTRFDTNSIVFMILLGVISNGLLITYMHKFFTFLVSESRKGYIQTAIVKNLNNNYSQNSGDGISNKLLFAIKKSFPGHVFQHIFINARYQYISTIKEQASFLITGLIIIEMALNIQGHLCYELLQNLLYKNYHIVLIIIFGIFLVVKATEIVSDYIFIHETRKYENR
jgi:hypothetical protein